MVKEQESLYDHVMKLIQSPEKQRAGAEHKNDPEPTYCTPAYHTLTHRVDAPAVRDPILQEWQLEILRRSREMEQENGK